MFHMLPSKRDFFLPPRELAIASGTGFALFNFTWTSRVKVKTGGEQVESEYCASYHLPGYKPSITSYYHRILCGAS